MNSENFLFSSYFENKTQKTYFHLISSWSPNCLKKSSDEMLLICFISMTGDHCKWYQFSSFISWNASNFFLWEWWDGNGGVGAINMSSLEKKLFSLFLIKRNLITKCVTSFKGCSFFFFFFFSHLQKLSNLFSQLALSVELWMNWQKTLHHHYHQKKKGVSQVSHQIASDGKALVFDRTMYKNKK